MRSMLAVLLCLSFPFVAIAAEEVEQRTVQATIGDLVTLPFELVAGKLWEHRLLTPDLVRIETNRRLADRTELVLAMRGLGRGRLEAVQIEGNRVTVRRYYFFEIKAKDAGQTARTNGEAGGTNEAARPARETAETRDFDFAVRVYEDGEYDEALHAFAIFRNKYPKSVQIPLAHVYEGQARFSQKKYAAALTSFKSAATTQDERLRALASLWVGNAADALGQGNLAVTSFMNAFGEQYPDIDIRARTGLAIHYARKGKTALADGQFKRLFRLYAATREQNSGYLPALFHAASFYDREGQDAEAAVRYYREYVALAERSLASAAIDEMARNALRRQTREAKARIDFLNRNYLDYH